MVAAEAQSPFGAMRDTLSKKRGWGVGLGGNGRVVGARCCVALNRTGDPKVGGLEGGLDAHGCWDYWIGTHGEGMGNGLDSDILDLIV